MIRALLLPCSLLFCAPSLGAITLGNTSMSSEVLGASSITWTHDNNCNTLSVQVQSRHGSFPTSVTFNGIGLKKRVEVPDADWSATSAIWTLVGAPSVSAPVVVTFGLNTATWAVADAISLCGVNQTIPMDATPASLQIDSATASLGITTATDGALVIDSIAHRDTGPFLAAGSGQSQRRNALTSATAAQDAAGSSFKTTATAGPTTMSWTIGNVAGGAHAAVAFRPAASGGLSYTPLDTADFEGGTNGSAATGLSAFNEVATSRTVYSSDVAGPFGSTLVGRTGFTAQGQTLFGGKLWAGDGSVTVSDGDKLWIRVYEYFPSSWSFDYAPNNPTGDGWGATSSFRVTLAGERGTFQTSTTGKAWGFTDEFGGTPSNLTFNAGSISAIPHDEWVCREYFVQFDTDPANGYIRYWQDGVFQGQVSGQTKPAGVSALDELIVGGYYNGGSPQAQVYYMDEIIVTREQPDDQDANGRPMIGCGRKVSDFGPSYTPIHVADFEGGTNGAAAIGPAAFDEIATSATVYSSDVAGPFGSALVARTGFTAQDQSHFGGKLWDGDGSVTVSDGDELWIRVYDYFPSSWSFDFSPNNSTKDGWGATKWFRVTLAGQRGTFQTSSAGKTWGFTDEFDSNASNLAFDEASISAIPHDQWVCREYFVHFDSDPANGYIRHWQDGVFQGQVSGQTKPAGASTLDELVVGDYYNGGSPQAQAYYMDEIIVTRERPDDQDSSGRPMIGCDRKVSDF